MSVQLELSYLLGKNEPEDLFDSYLPLRIPIAGQIDFKTQDALNAQAPNALLGIWVQETPTKKILNLVRLAQVNGLPFPEQTQPGLRFRKIHVRILSDLIDSQNQRVEYSIAYVIDKNSYVSWDDHSLPEQQWLALLTRNNAGFHLLHFKRDPGDPGGGGDPCVLAGCTDPNRTIITAIACACKGCG